MRKLKCISKEYQIWEVNKFWTKVDDAERWCAKCG